MFFLAHQSCFSSCLPKTTETFPSVCLRAFEQEAKGATSVTILKIYGERRKGLRSSLSNVLDTFWTHLPATHQSSPTKFLTKPQRCMLGVALSLSSRSPSRPSETFSQSLVYSSCSPCACLPRKSHLSHLQTLRSPVLFCIPSPAGCVSSAYLPDSTISSLMG